MDIFRRFKFYWKAKTIFDIHSPFLYELLSNFFKNTSISTKTSFKVNRLIQILDYFVIESKEDLGVISNRPILLVCRKVDHEILKLWEKKKLKGGLIIIGSGDYKNHQSIFENYNFDCNLYFYDFSIGLKLEGYQGVIHNYLVRWFYKPWRLGFF
ncbi:MAG: hypothetical protein RJA52_1126 [Bacteroidota bacterium]